MITIHTSNIITALHAGIINISKIFIQKVNLIVIITYQWWWAILPNGESCRGMWLRWLCSDLSDPRKSKFRWLPLLDFEMDFSWVS